MSRAVVPAATLLLSGTGTGLAAHRAHWGPVRRLSTGELVHRCRAVDLRGRGGAGFPFADKLATTAGARGRPVVVVNASEGEPASHKDAVLARTAPHLVLDGAFAVAGALGARDVHLVTGGADGVVESFEDALRERGGGGRLRVTFHRAAELFVESADFLRMDNVTLGYSLPRYGAFNSTRVFATVQNVFTTSKYSGIDPLAGLTRYSGSEPGRGDLTGIDNNTYPLSRILTVGLTVGF